MKKSDRSQPSLGKYAAWLSLTILIATTIFWALLSARLQASNADQLIDSDLFSSAHVFHEAKFLGTHNFLLKWPLFALLAYLGNTTHALLLATIGVALTPVLALAYLIWWLERRPSMRALWLLSLSLMLLLVPAQAAPGTLLPVNFAMLTTRNLEYVLFLIVLVVLARGWKQSPIWWFIATVSTVLLVASDKLFLPLLAVPAGVLLIARLRTRRLSMGAFMVFVGCAGGFGLLAALQHWQITHIVNPSNTSPYALALHPKQLVEAVVYAVLNIGTLFGANPMYAHATLVGVPGALWTSLRQPWALAYMINAAIALAVLVLTIRSLFHRTGDAARRLNWLLLSAGATSVAVFIATKHYYPVDARYLMPLWLAMVVAAVWSGQRLQLKPRVKQLLFILLLVSLPMTVMASYRQYTNSVQALQSGHAFQQATADQASHWQAAVLAGNYWDITPTRQLMSSRPGLLPLEDCYNRLPIQTSRAWRDQAIHSSVVFMLGNQPATPGEPVCTTAQTIAHFGQPTDQVLVNGGELLYYKKGLAAQTVTSRKPSLNDLSDCGSERLLTVVAHEDDDLLFMNPDTQAAISRGACLTTVYLTTGDDGQGNIYAADRMRAAEAAYAVMYGQPAHWQQDQVTIYNRPVSRARLVGVPRLQLLFYELPDGNVTGRGFKEHEYQSLARLEFGQINRIGSLSDQKYTATQLTQSLTAVMEGVQPTEVHTQDYSTNINDGDHSDHHATGYFTKRAFANYHGSALLYAYSGYPGRLLAADVNGATFERKAAVFYTYGMFDGATCHSVELCDKTAYHNYLPRQYRRLVALSVPTPVTYRGSTESGVAQPTLVTGANGQGGCIATTSTASLRCNPR